MTACRAALPQLTAKSMPGWASPPAVLEAMPRAMDVSLAFRASGTGRRGCGSYHGINAQGITFSYQVATGNRQFGSHLYSDDICLQHGFPGSALDSASARQAGTIADDGCPNQPAIIKFKGARQISVNKSRLWGCRFYPGADNTGFRFSRSFPDIINAYLTCRPLRRVPN